MSNTRIYTLRPFRELRIVTVEKANKFDKTDECIRVRVLSSNHLNKNEKNNCTAEIFGKELVIDKDYIFGFNEKFAIYTYTGCVIQIKGRTLQEYESKNNSMKEYLSLSYVLDAHRKLAKKKKKIGPRILITGNNNSGKSTASLLLCNYALKSGFTPFFIDADPKCSTDKIELNTGPGILSCFVYNNMNRKYSMDYFFGFLDIKEDLNLYYHLNECISSCVYLSLLNNLSQCATDFKNSSNDSSDMYSSGFIVSVPSEADLQMIQNLIQIYKINIVIIIDNSFLHYSLKYYYNKEGGEGGEAEEGVPGERVEKGEKGEKGVGMGTGNEMKESKMEKNSIENITENIETEVDTMEIIGLPKFEGVIPSDESRIRYCKNMWFYNYFSKDICIDSNYFKKNHLLVFKYSSTNFVKLDSTSAVPLSALPADCKNVKIENVSVSYYNSDMKNLINCILGVSYSKEFSYVHIMNIAAFVHVVNVTEIDQDVEEDKEHKQEKKEKKDRAGYGEKDEKEKEGERERERESEIINIIETAKNDKKEMDAEKEISYIKENDNGQVFEGDEIYEQNEIYIEDNEKKNPEQQNEQEEEKKKDYLIEILCPVTITMKNIPPFFVVPGNSKQIKC